MTKKQNPNSKNSKLKHPFIEFSDIKDALTIVEGRFGEPVKIRSKFINANYPPDDFSQEELERIWGKPREKDRNLLNNIKVDRKRRNKPSFQ